MSTRSTVHFVHEEWGSKHIVYVHHDGYPSYRGKQVLNFLRELQTEVKDTRFGAAGVTAARFVGYMLQDYHDMAVKRVEESALAKEYTDTHPLGAISVKLVEEDPSDIEYRYIVRCDHLDEEGIPEVLMQQVAHIGLLGGGENQYAEGDNLKEVMAGLES